MIQVPPPSALPVLLAAIRQSALSGELVLEQHDGTRRIRCSGGAPVHLRSDVAGEQFGHYLLRQGILDFAALRDLLEQEDPARLGDRVIQWGMMTVQERDFHLLSLQEQIMIHALEHGILTCAWQPATQAAAQDPPPPFPIDARHFIWNTFQEARPRPPFQEALASLAGGRWEGRVDLLESVADLPLTPAKAYALGFLGPEAVTYETFLALSGLEETESATLLATLWGLGALTLTEGELPALEPAPEVPAPEVPPAAPTAPPPLLPPQAPPPPEAPPPAQASPEPLLLHPGPPSGDLGAPEETAPQEPPPAEGPHRAKRLLHKAKQFQLQERTSEAVRCLEQSVQLDPEGPSAYEAWLLLGRLRMANPAWSTRAIDAFQSASRLRPQAAEPWAAMGELYHRKYFRSNALACFQRALERDPSVAIPPDVLVLDAPPSPQGAPASLLSKVRSLLGGPDRKAE